jgi:elongation factor Ts
MIITASVVKKLRVLTGAGVMECKKALIESDGDINKAARRVHGHGLSAISKKTSSVAKDGIITISYSHLLKKITMAEVNSETDFCC